MHLANPRLNDAQKLPSHVDTRDLKTSSAARSVPLPRGVQVACSHWCECEGENLEKEGEAAACVVH